MNLRYTNLAGFKYCDMLDGAIVDTFAPINTLGTSVADGNILKKELVKLIDQTAKDSYQYILDVFENADPLVPR